MKKLLNLSIQIRTAALLAALLSISNLAGAQDSTVIHGVVLSHLNQPVENVSVSIEGSYEMPVLSDAQGVFILKSASADNWILLSPTGNFKVKRIYVDNRSSMTVNLTPKDIPSGDDDFIILDQVRKRKDIVSAASEVNFGTRHYTSAMSIDQHMQGQVPGMNVINRSGMPASGAVTTLRGVNSLYADNQPLYIVDGIPMISQGLLNSNLAGFEYNPLTSVNPFDISNMIVIKDPSITSAYGSKASNGVIFIQTLNPSVTQTTIELDYRNGVSLGPSNLIPQLSGGQHKTLISELLVSSGLYEEIIREEYPNLYLEEDDVRYIDYQHNTNWQELIFNDALYTNVNLNVKGGDEIARYGLSFGYTDANGIIKSTNYQGYNLRFVSRLNVFTWLKMDAGVSLNYNYSVLKEAATVNETSPILTSLAKSPLLNPYQYDLEGKMITKLSEVDELGISNPMATIQNYEARNNNFNFVSTMGVEGIITDNLKVKSKFNLSYNILKEQIFMPNRGMEHYYDDEAINVAKLSNNDLNSFFNNTYVTYNKTIANSHKITANTGLNIQANKYQFDWGLSKNAHENDEYRMIQDGLNNLREIGGANKNWNWLSVYEYVTYSYKDKYLVTGSLSLDGSSRVGDSAINTISLGGVPFGIFYGTGIAWRISNEAFLSDLSMLDELKLRVSYGKSGNDDIGEASATNYYTPVKFRETVGLYPATVPNGNLTYETVSQVNVGLDVSLFGRRFSATVDAFRSSTDNMLFYRPLNSFFGYDLRLENGGTMVNSGVEFSTYLRLLEKGFFRWDLMANVSSIKNEVTSIEGGQLSYTIPGGEKINKIGAPANSFYGYIFNGVYSTQAEAEAAGLVNDKDLPYGAGDAIFEDISGPGELPDGVINSYDKTIIGSPMPELFGALTNRISYKRWTLNATVQFVYGVEIFNYIRFKNESMRDLSNQSSAVLNRWQFEGHETDIPRALWKDPMGNSDFSTRWIEDGSYLRLKNITLSYKIPQQLLVFRNSEFYVSANNMVTMTRYLGYDPEFAYSHSQNYQGVDYGQMPQARQFIAGIKLGF